MNTKYGRVHAEGCSEYFFENCGHHRLIDFPCFGTGWAAKIPKCNLKPLESTVLRYLVQLIVWTQQDSAPPSSKWCKNWICNHDLSLQFLPYPVCSDGPDIVSKACNKAQNSDGIHPEDCVPLLQDQQHSSGLGDQPDMKKRQMASYKSLVPLGPTWKYIVLLFISVFCSSSGLLTKARKTSDSIGMETWILLPKNRNMIRRHCEWTPLLDQIAFFSTSTHSFRRYLSRKLNFFSLAISIRFLYLLHFLLHFDPSLALLFCMPKKLLNAHLYDLTVWYGSRGVSPVNGPLVAALKHRGSFNCLQLCWTLLSRLFKIY